MLRGYRAVRRDGSRRLRLFAGKCPGDGVPPKDESWGLRQSAGSCPGDSQVQSAGIDPRGLRQYAGNGPRRLHPPGTPRCIGNQFEIGARRPRWSALRSRWPPGPSAQQKTSLRPCVGWSPNWWATACDLDTALPDPDLHLSRARCIGREFARGHAPEERRQRQQYSGKGI
jgi:hypothetical protein